MRPLRFDSRLLLLLAFSIFAVAPLTAPGYFIYAHDARHSVYFLQMFDLSFKDGAWYPRWATDMVFGYGYPLWLILAPIPFFAGEAFHLLGLDFVSAVKLVDGLAVMLSGFTMYLFASRVLGKNGALVAAVAYIYIPYHLVDLYVRGAQAELLSFVFPPLIFWALHQLAASRRVLFVPLLALAFAGLVLTHISISVLFAPIVALYGLFLLVTLYLKSTSSSSPSFTSSGSGQAALRFVLQAFVAALLAFGLAAVFVLPILAEQRYLTSDPLIGGFFNYRKHFVNLSQLLSPFWGYGYAGEYGTDQFSLQLGLVPVLLSLVALMNWRRTDRESRRHVGFFIALVIIAVMAMLPISAAAWEPLAGIVAFLQFPWRFLGVTALGLGFLSGASIEFLDSRQNRLEDLVPALLVILLLLTSTYSYTEPQHTDAVFNHQTQMEFEVKDRELLGDTIWMEPGKRPEDSPLVAQYINGETLTKAVALDEGAVVQAVRHAGQSDEVRVQADKAARVMFYTRYFPGWAATIDGIPAPLTYYGEQGLIMVQVPAGDHLVRIQFQDTPIRQIGAAISGVALLATLLLLVASLRQKVSPAQVSL